MFPKAVTSPVVAESSRLTRRRAHSTLDRIVVSSCFASPASRARLVIIAA
jgi:hypothetical protein